VTRRRSKFTLLSRKRLLAIGASMPVEPLTLRDTLRRELYLRELALRDLADRLDLAESTVYERIVPSPTRKKTGLTPLLLDRIIGAVHIDKSVAERMHLLGAREAGWKV
jgi:hypothetical protein